MIPIKEDSLITQFSSLVEKIYAASADPGLWPGVVEFIALAVGGVQAMLFTPYHRPAVGGFLYPWRVEEQDLIRYATQYIDHDVWAKAAQRLGVVRDCNVQTDEDLLPHGELLESVYYKEFLSPMGVARLCSGVIFAGGPGLPGTVLSVYRGPYDAPFSQRDRHLMQLLMPHLSRALGLMHRLGLARHQEQAMRTTLDRLSVGVFLLNELGTVIFSNSAGKSVLARNDGLNLNAEQRLGAAGTQNFAGQRLEDWLSSVFAKSKTEQGNFNDTFQVTRSNCASRYSVQCCALGQGDPLVSAEGASYVVFVTDPERLELPGIVQLQQVLGLTAAEARVATAMVQGGTNRDVANALSISEETVRSHCKSIYSKIHIGDKASLTRVLLSLGKAIA